MEPIVAPQLAMMRHIFQNPGDEYREGASQTQIILRDLLRDRSQDFLKRMERLELEHSRAVAAYEKRIDAKRARKASKRHKPEVDLGTERALALCVERLKALAEETK